MSFFLVLASCMRAHMMHAKHAHTRAKRWHFAKLSLQKLQKNHFLGKKMTEMLRK